MAPEKEKEAQPRPGRTPLELIKELAWVVGIAIVVSLVVKTFLLQAFFIPSGSMESTLDIGDRVLVSKLTPTPFELHRGDVVVFEDPDDWLGNEQVVSRNGFSEFLAFIGLAPEGSENHLIKRVIGLPGDHVVGREGERLTVNGVAIEESEYLDEGTLPTEVDFDVTVPAGELWVMGDNRQKSSDSRYHQEDANGGFVPIEDVTGRAYAVAWPLTHWDWLGTPDDFDEVR